MNTLEFYIERWDDPGVYPSNAGSGPLPSYSYPVAEGEVTTDGDPNDFVPGGFTVTKWQKDGNTYTPLEVECCE